jgi:hypothetical protein
MKRSRLRSRCDRACCHSSVTWGDRLAVFETGRVELERLPAHQLRQAGRQFLGTGHPGPVKEDRDHLDPARQGRLDLQPHEVFGIVEATLPVHIGDRQPLGADQWAGSSRRP